MWPKQKDCPTFYGNPLVNNAAWQRKNLVRVPVPWKTTMGSIPIKTITIHQKCADSLRLVLGNAWEDINASQAEADRRGWSAYSGSYYLRAMRGLGSLSMHAYGAALDFDAPDNGLGTSVTDARGFRADDPLVKAFEAQGWTWGGRWKSRSDPMHFQAANV